MNKSFNPGVPLTVCTLVALGILIFLGSWQAGRIAPKTLLVASVEAGLAAKPMPLPDDIADTSVHNYQRVRFEGVRTAEPILVFGMNQAGKAGYFLYAPIKRKSRKSLIVNFGWIPFEHKTPVSIPKGQVALSGILLPSAEAGTMTPDNDAANGSWYLADVPQMAVHFGLQHGEYFRYRVYADHVGAKSNLPLGGQVLVNIPNNHFEYMLTWYGLAAALIGVYATFGYSRGQKTA